MADQNLITVVLYMVRQEILIWECWNLFRIMHYVLEHSKLLGIQFMHRSKWTAFIPLMKKIISAVCSCFMNPTVECVFNLKSKRLFARKPTQIAPLGIRIAENLSSIGFSNKNRTLRTVPYVPPWLLRRPWFNYDMYAFDKNSVSTDVLQNLFVETKNGFGKHVEIYTDSLKTGEAVACAVICGKID